ncbi:hypothetical protein J4410_00765 [Candidatus Woesearchaeota archaeon]|nr:hypothetical protein [Candidatus Woesearchaeota archaeon]
MIHSKDVLRWLTPNHPKWVMTTIFFFLYPIEGSFGKLMLLEIPDLFIRLYLGQRYVLVIFLYAAFVAYLLSCVIYHFFVWLMQKYQKKPEHPLYDIEKYYR